MRSIEQWQCKRGGMCGWEPYLCICTCTPPKSPHCLLLLRFWYTQNSVSVSVSVSLGLSLCLSVSVSVSVSLSEVLGLLAWSSEHCLLVFHYLDELLLRLLLLLCNGYFFGINFSWGHQQICLSAPTHGRHGKKKKRIWSPYGTQQSLCVCVSVCLSVCVSAFPQMALEEDLFAIGHNQICLWALSVSLTHTMGRRFDPFRKFAVLKFSGLQQNLHCDAAQLKFLGLENLQLWWHS